MLRNSSEGTGKGESERKAEQEIERWRRSGEGSEDEQGGVRGVRGEDKGEGKDCTMPFSCQWSKRGRKRKRLMLDVIEEKKKKKYEKEEENKKEKEEEEKE